MPKEERDNEQQRPRKGARQQTSWKMRVASLVLVLCVLGYFGVQIYRYFQDPYPTYAVYQYQVEDSVTLNGVVVRDEEVLTSTVSGIPSLERSEGERVGAGKVLAVIYQDQASQDRQTQLQALQAQLEQLEYAQTAAADSEASLRLDNQIAAGILSLQADLSADKLADAEEHISQLRSLVLKRDYTYQDSADLTAQIQDLKSQIQSLQSAVSSGATTVKAPKAGTYSAVVDGYEKTLTPDMLESITPQQLKAVQADTSVTSDLGKMIYGDTWYYAAIVDQETASEFTVGASTTLRFVKGLERELPVEVESVGQVQDGEQVVVFSSNKYLSEVTQLRRQAADVIRSTYSGLRVPQDALRVVTEEVKNEETGETTQNQVTGVYCLVGVNALFKPVDVIYNGDGFCLVKGTSDKEKTLLRAGDQVIVTAEELYDGKVVA